MTTKLVYNITIMNPLEKPHILSEEEKKKLVEDLYKVNANPSLVEEVEQVPQTPKKNFKKAQIHKIPDPSSGMSKDWLREWEDNQKDSRNQ